jgi:hypothetical protein
MNARLKGGAVALAMLASAAFAGSANAATQFDPGVSAPTAGFTIVNEFTSMAGIACTGTCKILTGTTSDGAAPANSDGSSYLSVLAMSTATITFAQPVSAFQFDWGSVDTYNTLTINGSGQQIIIPGSGVFTNTPGNGNQSAINTNGLFTVTADPGQYFTSITLASRENSFEIDKLAVKPAVPEPATWAMMLVGFGGVGFAMRRRKMTRTAVSLV